MSDTKIVDLVSTNDGSYAPKGHTNIPAKVKSKAKREPKPKYRLGKNVNEFLAGVDVGIELANEVGKRVDKFLKMRG